MFYIPVLCGCFLIFLILSISNTGATNNIAHSLSIVSIYPYSSKLTPYLFAKRPLLNFTHRINQTPKLRKSKNKECS